MTDTEQTIDLDRKHRAIRSGARIAIQRRKSDGTYDMIASFQGGARAIQRWCQENNVYPTREAETELSRVPEKGFVDRV